MCYYMVAPQGEKTKVAPSLGAPELANPTCLPEEMLAKYHFVFLIRHPRRSIPSYFRCTVPPLRDVTGFDSFMPSEAGYLELRRLFSFLVERGIVDKDNLVVVDADALLDDPKGTVAEFCGRVGLQYSDDMLQWTDEDREYAEIQFQKWAGFHDDALSSSSLKARTHAHVRFCCVLADGLLMANPRSRRLSSLRIRTGRKSTAKRRRSKSGTASMPISRITST